MNYVWANLGYVLKYKRRSRRRKGIKIEGAPSTTEGAPYSPIGPREGRKK